MNEKNIISEIIKLSEVIIAITATILLIEHCIGIIGFFLNNTTKLIIIIFMLTLLITKSVIYKF